MAVYVQQTNRVCLPITYIPPTECGIDGSTNNNYNNSSEEFGLWPDIRPLSLVFTVKMSSNYDSLLAVCKDESASDRFVRKLSSGVAPNASSIDAKYPVLFHCWVEEQVRLYAKHTLNADLGPTIVPVQGVVLSTPSEEKVSVPATIPPPSIKANELEGLTFGGIKIEVKAKQQKKRMTPNLVSDKPNIHAVQGNINSLAARNEVADIRKELKDIGSSFSTESKGMPKDSDTLPNRSILGAVDGSIAASQSTAKPEPALPVATSCSTNCPDCAKLEDLSSVVRLASIYGKLVLHQYLPLAKVLPVIQQLTSLDPDLCSKTSLPVCSNANPVLLPLAKDSLLINNNCIRTFLRSLLGQLYPLLTSCGHLIANEIADAVSVRTWAPELSVKIKELLSNNASEHAAMVGLSSGSANFRLPETFQKPFREDLDSRNEFKTQVRQSQEPFVYLFCFVLLFTFESFLFVFQLELATFYERERTYDELSNLFLRYQTTNRSDLTGSAIKMFFRTDLLKTGTTVRLFALKCTKLAILTTFLTKTLIFSSDIDFERTKLLVVCGIIYAVFAVSQCPVHACYVDDYHQA